MVFYKLWSFTKTIIRGVKHAQIAATPNLASSLHFVKLKSLITKANNRYNITKNNNKYIMVFFITLFFIS